MLQFIILCGVLFFMRIAIPPLPSILSLRTDVYPRILVFMLLLSQVSDREIRSGFSSFISFSKFSLFEFKLLMFHCIILYSCFNNILGIPAKMFPCCLMSGLSCHLLV